MRKFQVHVTARVEGGEARVGNDRVKALSAFTDSLDPSFERAVHTVSLRDNVAYGFIGGVVNRKDAPCLEGVKYRDPEAATILAEDFKKRAKAAGFEASVEVMSRSAYLALIGR